MEQWRKGLAGIPMEIIETALDYCRVNMEWPPSIAEFIKTCEKAAGMPTIEEAFAAAIRRDFYHPVVQHVFDKIGDWAMRHDSEIELRKKFKTAYEQILGAHREAVSRKLIGNG